MKSIKTTKTPIVKGVSITPIQGLSLKNPLGSYTAEIRQKQELNRAVNPIITEFENKKKSSSNSSAAASEEVDITVGLFFDGTGNNRYCSELVYYNENFWDNKTLRVNEKKIKETYTDLKNKNVITTQNIVNKKNTDTAYELESDMFDEENAPSYLNPYSNIVLLYDIYPEKKHSQEITKIILKHYVQGIGTLVELEENGITPKTYYSDDIMGSSAGRGERGVIARVEQGLLAITKKIKKELEGKNITINTLTFDIFGFSRGATAARHCANELAKKKKGLELHDAGKFGDQLALHEIAFPKNIKIRFVGLFDTVEADTSYDDNLSVSMIKKAMIELPELISHPANVLYEELYGNFEAINTSLENLDAKVMHIMAIDEYRNNFPLTVNNAPNKYDLYLFGSHSDIGGGYAEANYRSLIAFDTIGGEERLTNFNKIATSYEKKFAWKFENGQWKKNPNQIQVIQGQKRYSVPRVNSPQPPVALGYNYEMYDERFITNKIYLVSLNAMKLYAQMNGVPFPDKITRNNIPVYSDIRFYELPPNLPFLKRYNDTIEKAVKNPGKENVKISVEDYYNLYHHCIHISANYNRSILGKYAAKQLPVLFINIPTENKQRLFLKPR
ncbi:phospholipase effector Tle1 domain-containing protein [Chryseobacterium sp. CT-SW4]|uniref:phospholipase effector Tle1 domain-containing protein n=1 Tax=Chryseobacterium sp. SW-1 TaxID=3157343 RepID=UPI003B0251D8